MLKSGLQKLDERFVFGCRRIFKAAELRLDRVQRQGQRVGVLLTEGVEVEAVQQGREARLLFSAASHWARVVPRRLPGAQGS